MSVTRRTFLRTAALAAGVTATACPLRAQPRTIKVGAVFPVTGAMAEVGQDCRAGAKTGLTQGDVESQSSAPGIRGHLSGALDS